jgi:hypothetical protein
MITGCRRSCGRQNGNLLYVFDDDAEFRSDSHSSPETVPVCGVPSRESLSDYMLHVLSSLFVEI